MHRQVLERQCEQLLFLLFDNDAANMSFGEFAHQQYAGIAHAADEVEAFVEPLHELTEAELRTIGAPRKEERGWFVVGDGATQLAEALAVQGMAVEAAEEVPADLQESDVVVALEPLDAPQQERLARFVDDGGGLFLVGAVTGGMTADPPIWDVTALKDRFTAMPTLIQKWTQESGRDSGFATAAAAAIVILLIFVLLLNITAILLRNRYEKKRST